MLTIIRMFLFDHFVLMILIIRFLLGLLIGCPVIVLVGVSRERRDVIGGGGLRVVVMILYLALLYNILFIGIQILNIY